MRWPHRFGQLGGSAKVEKQTLESEEATGDVVHLAAKAKTRTDSASTGQLRRKKKHYISMLEPQVRTVV